MLKNLVDIDLLSFRCTPRMYFFLLFFGAFLWTACEEVIQVPLKEAEAHLVIEGNLSDIETSHYVKISKTVSFSANSTGNPQSGAVVRIKEEDGLPGISAIYGLKLKEERVLPEVSPGLYELRNYRARPGMKYTLEVNFEEKTYLASSTMPLPVPIDSIGTVTDSFFGDESKTVGIIYQDQEGVANYYRAVVSVNGKVSSAIFVYSDKYNDGKQVQRNLYDDDLDLKKGDAVEVAQWAIDRAVYTYFYGIQSNNPGAAAPANPVSNFSNGALGYFSAHSITTASTSIL